MLAESCFASLVANIVVVCIGLDPSSDQYTSTLTFLAIVRYCSCDESLFDFRSMG